MKVETVDYKASNAAETLRAGCGADLRLCGFAAAEAVDPEHTDPV